MLKVMIWESQRLIRIKLRLSNFKQKLIAFGRQAHFYRSPTIVVTSYPASLP